jgi:hypothetical protein
MSETDFFKEYYIEPDFAWLAGPYETSIKSHKKMLDNVINDMIAGGVDYRITEDSIGRSIVERRGMILSKR